MVVRLVGADKEALDKRGGIGAEEVVESLAETVTPVSERNAGTVSGTRNQRTLLETMPCASPARHRDHNRYAGFIPRIVQTNSQHASATVPRVNTRTLALNRSDAVARKQQLTSSTTPRHATRALSSSTPAVDTDEDDDDDDDVPAPLKWYERACEFTELPDRAALDKAINSGDSAGQLVVVDIYASWCQSCKAAFPMLCKLPKEKEMKANFKFYKRASATVQRVNPPTLALNRSDAVDRKQQLTSFTHPRHVTLAQRSSTETVDFGDNVVDEDDDSDSDDDDGPAPLKWYERACEFTELPDRAALDEAINSGDSASQLVVVDFYASWCHSCKAAFPTLCKLPKEKEMNANFKFYKANVATEDIKEYLKNTGVTGIPRLLVYKPNGEILAEFSGTMKKMPIAKLNLGVIANNKTCERFSTGPAGTLIPEL
eukprot:gene7173-279_t